MSNYQKIVCGKYVYYVSSMIMQRNWLNDTFAFNTNDHLTKMQFSDFVVDRTTNEFVKQRHFGEQMADSFLNINDKDVVKFMTAYEAQ